MGEVLCGGFSSIVNGSWSTAVYFSVLKLVMPVQEHPPKKEKAVKPDVTGENMKKGLQIAILHYHPVCHLQNNFTMPWDFVTFISMTVSFF